MFASPFSTHEQRRHGRTRNRASLGGLFLINDYEQMHDGKIDFHGHGVYGWDPATARYSMSWFDSGAYTGGQVCFGDWPGDTLRFERPGEVRYEYQPAGADQYEFRILVCQDGAWLPMMTSTFRRAHD